MGAADVARAAPILAVRFDGEALRAIDHTLLPWEYVELSLNDAAEVAAAIGRLAIRGAPLIGVAAAYGVALELARESKLSALHRACSVLGESRPTAVNLRYAIERVRNAALAVPEERMAQAALAEAHAIQASEEVASAAMAANGAELLAGTRTVLTHCNSGALAAPGRGTALAVIAELADRGSLRNVLATETRPLLQGARLTAYELRALKIPHQLVVDSAAPALIAAGDVQAVLVGCDRVAANGDVANKIGTYSLALAAHAAGIPFVVVGPTSTIDLDCADGSQIVIEQRAADEVRQAAGNVTALDETECLNPAFDVTPARLIDALVTERGVARPPSAAAIASLVH
ncbi:MAG: S-methyl-5-thioribose-1-phosphate isomerase [Actinomycetota bacterium]|nr:S-methyl-5-thioribose-1-phosphate isomerase [Actinomycetota bacterium]